MKKQMTGVLLALCLCLALLPGTAEAAYEPPKEVSQVTLSVTPPAVGGALTAPTVDSNEPYFIDSDSLFDSSFADTFYWNRVAAEGCTASAGYLYEEGGTSLVNDSWYRLHVRLKLDYGHYFAENVTATVDGATKTEVERYRDDTVYVSAWFKVGHLPGPPTAVSTVTLTDVPTTREDKIETWTDAIQKAAVSDGCQICYASLREWDSADDMWHYSDSSGSTDASKIYGALLTINPLPNHVFADTVTATVNGSAAEVVGQSIDEVEIFVPFDNVTIDKVEVKSATWPIDGAPIPKDAGNFYLDDYFSNGSYPYTLKSARFQIKDGENYRDLNENETKFSYYSNYRVIAELKAKSYATFADTVTGDFNGTDGVSCEISADKKTCTVTCGCTVYDRIHTYPANEPNNHINSVTIHQDDPQPGEKYADGVYAPAGSRTMLVGANGSYAWHEVPCVGSTEGIKKLTNTDTFEAGKVYWYSLTLRNADGYRFGNGFTVSFKQLDGTDSNYAMKQCKTDSEKRKEYNLWYTVGDVTQTPITQVAVTGPAYQNGTVDISDPDAFRADAPVTLRSLTYNNNHLSFTLLPQSGHYFGRTVAVTYNSKEARVSDGFFSSFDIKYIGVSYSSEPATPVTVTGIAAQDKVYDGTTSAELDISQAVLSGVEANDDVTLDLSGVTAVFADKNAGTGKTVTVTGQFKLAGKNADKYTLTQPDLRNLKADIAACPEFTDATNKNQTIYVGSDQFAVPRFTGVTVNGKAEEVTGEAAYTLENVPKTAAEISEGLKSLKAGEQLEIGYTFTASGNYSGEKNGTITVTAQNRPSGRIFYEIAVAPAENGTVSSGSARAGFGDTVTLTVKPDSGYALETLTVTDQTGNERELTDKGGGVYTFTMPAGRVEVRATFMEDNSVLNFFYDVPNGAYYYEAVKWAVENGVTNGIGNNIFGPELPCTRAQVITFLYRAAGFPDPATWIGSGNGPDAYYLDVPAEAYYYHAVMWAAKNGITNGTDETHFSPDAVCTRAQAVTFLARALKADAAGETVFHDVPADSCYAAAVAWAAENGVTEGVGNGHFAPDDSCTRGQIVTFLWRAYEG